VFITKDGHAWAKATSTNPVTQEMTKLLRAAGFDGRKGMSFYGLRHTFRTIADEAKDQPVADQIMGHEIPGMSSVYRQKIGDDRLKAVTDRVRAWLFAEAASESPAA
jgi:integrase